METIKHYSSFPATGVSLRQMVQFGERPSTGKCTIRRIPTGWQPDSPVTSAGTLFRASQFLSEELPIRLAHRVQELGNLPDGLNEMASIRRVQDWYAQSFEVSSWITIDPPRAPLWYETRILRLYHARPFLQKFGNVFYDLENPMEVPPNWARQRQILVWSQGNTGLKRAWMAMATEINLLRGGITQLQMMARIGLRSLTITTTGLQGH